MYCVSSPQLKNNQESTREKYLGHSFIYFMQIEFSRFVYLAFECFRQTNRICKINFQREN